MAKTKAKSRTKAAARKSGEANPKSKAKKAEKTLIEVLKRYIRSHAGDFLKDPNINSVGIGYKMIQGKVHPTLALQFAVNQKVSPEAVAEVSALKIPPTIEVEGNRVPTDVVQRSFKPGYELVAQIEKDDRKKRLERLVPGISVAHVECTAGTLGCIVLDKQSGEPAMLSNWHVFHTRKGNIGDVIVQPGPFDDNRVESNRVGKLRRSHLGVAGDCALASIEGRSFDTKILELSVPVTKIGKPELGDRVVKSGRTTGTTYGIVTRIETMTSLNYEGQTEIIGGFEIGPDPKKLAKDNEISRGGDSGSCWMALQGNGKPSEVMLGLHFGGDAEGSDGEFALACYAHSVFEKLEILPYTGPQLVAQPEARRRPDREELRLGFQADFLDFPVPLPNFTTSIRSDLAQLEGAHAIPYCHFTVWLSKSRKLPRLVAWNIDGTAIKKLSRSSLPFKKDERGNLEKYQVGDELYYDNPFDRGHVARRADLCWGPKSEAMQANRDSFFFTNITPQHESFNQSKRRGLWGLLENAIFEDVDVANLRVSLMGGPILGGKDPTYSDVAQVPVEYWKIVAYTDEADGEHKIRAFVLTQKDLIGNITRPQVLELDEFHWYQVPVGTVEEATGIRFGSLTALDTMPAVPQIAGRPPARLIQATEDFFR